MKYVFDFERLEVYQLAIRHAVRIFEITEHFPSRVQSSLGDQLCRASVSVANNIAEGSGKRSRKEKARYDATAFSSARECVPGVTIAHERRYLDDAARLELRDNVARLCSMLARLEQSVSRSN
jgi:four helix bundle protein